MDVVREVGVDMALLDNTVHDDNTLSQKEELMRLLPSGVAVCVYVCSAGHVAAAALAADALFAMYST
jgi:hypothetical protein